MTNGLTMSIRMMLVVMALGLVMARDAGALCFIDGRPRTDYQTLQKLGDAVDASRAVFEGEVMASTSTRDTLRVERVWKGDLGAEVGIVKGETRPDGAILRKLFAFGFAVGQRYLVFAHRESIAELAASDCAWTTALTHAAPTIGLLNQLETPLVRMQAGTAGYDALQLSARSFFEAVSSADKEKLVNATNAEARDRVRNDLRNSRSRFARILLTGSDSVRARIRPIRRLPVVLLQHPDFANRAAACVVDPADAAPGTIREVPAVHGSDGIVCIPFLRAPDGWIVSYEFAYPAWDPPANPGLRQSDASARR